MVQDVLVDQMVEYSVDREFLMVASLMVLDVVLKEEMVLDAVLKEEMVSDVLSHMVAMEESFAKTSDSHLPVTLRVPSLMLLATPVMFQVSFPIGPGFLHVLDFLVVNSS